MTADIRIISSMATRRLLADLAARFESAAGQRVSLESVGGVDAARRVAAGEPFDAVVLASEPIDALIRSGHVVAGSRVDLVQSPIAVAVRRGAPRPDIGSADAVRRAVLAANTVGASTGPSGDYLARLFHRWGIADEVKDRIVQAPAGIPVATLVARGDVELGFQQLSEMMNAAGIDVLGPLPTDIQFLTIFSGGVATASAQPAAARALLSFMASSEVALLKREHGMEPG
jgi:molybdate transport system substrate-binding protein